MIRGAVILGLALTVAAARPAPAFTLLANSRAPTGSPPFYHWDLRSFPSCEVPYAVNATGTPDFAGEHAEIDKAFGVWQAVEPAIVRVRNVGNTNTVGVAKDKENVLFWDNDLCSGDSWDPALKGGAIATTSFVDVSSTTGLLGEVDIVFDDEHFDWNAGTQALRIGDDGTVGDEVQEPANGNGECDTTAVCDDDQDIDVGDPANAGDVCVSPGADGVLDSAPNVAGTVDVWAVAAHEIGHFFGLGENNDAGNGGEVADTMNDGPFTFAAASTLDFTVNGVAMTAGLAAGERTAADVAQAINLALALNAPGTATATVRGGGVRIQAANPAHDVVVTGGTGAGTLGLLVNESGLSTMRQFDEPRQATTLDARTLSRDDIDGLNFLYSPDLGDAPDEFKSLGFNRYPSRVHAEDEGSKSRLLNGVQLYVGAEGAEALFGVFGGLATPRYQYEWLGTAAGRIDDSALECEARVPDADAFDDGVTFANAFRPGGPAVAVTVHVRTGTDVAGGKRAYDLEFDPLYLNAWFDWNANGRWDDAGEHVIGGTASERLSAAADRVFTITPPAGAVPGGFARVRLDYREDAGQPGRSGHSSKTDPSLSRFKGATQFGEVEDHQIPYLDHLQCYEVKPAPFVGPTVTLTDQFGTVSGVPVERPQRLCAPANKNEEDPTAPAHVDHLLGYRIRHAFGRVPNQRIVNQFGETFVDVVRPDRLMVPSRKSLTASPPAPVFPALDHFECYTVRHTPRTPKFTRIEDVRIEDQFGTAVVTLTRPTRLCAPVNKNNERPGAETHTGHLLCYRTTPVAFGTVPAYVNNQFGPRTVTLIAEREFCVPSLKNPPPPPTTTTTTSTTTSTSTTTTTTTTSTTTSTVVLAVTHIEFDHAAPDDDTADGLDPPRLIATDLTHKGSGVGEGEWVKGPPNGPPTRNEPALSVAGKTVSIKARFTVQPATIASAKIRASAQGGELQSVVQPTVNFVGGVSNPEYVELPLGGTTGVLVSKIADSWEWLATDVNGGGGVP